MAKEKKRRERATPSKEKPTKYFTSNMKANGTKAFDEKGLTSFFLYIRQRVFLLVVTSFHFWDSCCGLHLIVHLPEEREDEELLVIQIQVTFVVHVVSTALQGIERVLATTTITSRNAETVFDMNEACANYPSHHFRRCQTAINGVGTQQALALASTSTSTRYHLAPTWLTRPPRGWDADRCGSGGLRHLRVILERFRGTWGNCGDTCGDIVQVPAIIPRLAHPVTVIIRPIDWLKSIATFHVIGRGPKGPLPGKCWVFNVQSGIGISPRGTCTSFHEAFLEVFWQKSIQDWIHSRIGIRQAPS